MRITLQDGRQIVGKFMAFDKFMNLVLADCEEFRKIIPKGSKGEEVEQKRTLGFILIRGENIVSIVVEGPPPAEDSRVKSILTKQAGSTAPRGLSGVAQGVAVSAARGMAISRGAPIQQVPVGLMGATPLGVVPQQGVMNTMMQPMNVGGRGVASTMNVGGRGRGSIPRQ